MCWNQPTRRLLTNTANLRELVEQVGPVLAGLLDFSRAAVVERSFLLNAWRRRESDLLFEVPLLDSVSGASALVCLLGEPQGAEREPLLELARTVQSTEPQRREVDLLSQPIELIWTDEWLAEDEAKGEAEGRAEGKAAAILRTFRLRLGAMPADVSTAVSNTEVEERLDALQDAAVVCRDLEEFRSRLAR